MTFVSLISLIVMKGFLLVTNVNRNIFQYFLLPIIYILLILLYPKVSDTKHYYEALESGIYSAEIGYNFVQEILKNFFSTDVTFYMILLIPLSVYLVLMRYSAIGTTYLLCSQLVVLLHMNGVRQGYAVVLLYLGLILILDRKLILGFFVLFCSGLFHMSGYLVGLIILVTYIFGIFDFNRLVSYLIIGLTVVILVLSLSSILIQIGTYTAYLEHKEQHTSRTSPLLKHSLLFVYFLFLEYKLRSFYSGFKLLFNIRFSLIVLAMSIYILLGLSEVSSRIFVYCFSLEAIILFAIIWRGHSIPLNTKLFWTFFQVANPSVLGLLRLSL